MSDYELMSERTKRILWVIPVVGLMWFFISIFLREIFFNEFRINNLLIGLTIQSATIIWLGVLLIIITENFGM